MAKKPSLFDDLFYIASRLPWWLSLGIAAGLGVYLHSVASAPVTTYTDIHQLQSMALSNVAHIAATFGQYLLPLIFGMGALASLWGKYKRRNSPEANGAELKRKRAETKKPQPRPTVEVVRERARPVVVEPVAAAEAVAEPLSKQAAPVLPKAPACPHCRKPMVIRVARSGANAGGNFWGCGDYPKCRGMRRFN